MSRRLLLLNGLAVFGVIINHAIGYGYNAMFWWADRYRPVAVPNFDQLYSVSYFFFRFLEQLIIFTIPSFLFVSGFFVVFATKKAQQTVAPKFLLNRLITIILPYLIWSFIALALDAVLVRESTRTPLEYVRILLLGQALPPFYYVPLLVQLYILSWVLVPLARQRPKLLLAGAVFLTLLVQAGRYALTLGIAPNLRDFLSIVTSGWFFPGNLIWFILGMVVSAHQVSFKERIRSMRWVLVGLWGILLIAGIIEWELLRVASGQNWIAPRETLIDNLYAAVFIFTFLSFDLIPTGWVRRLEWLGQRSFGIYLVHLLVILYLAKIAYRVTPVLLGQPVLFVILLAIAALIIPLLLMEVVRRTPLTRFYRILFG